MSIEPECVGETFPAKILQENKLLVLDGSDISKASLHQHHVIADVKNSCEILNNGSLFPLVTTALQNSTLDNVKESITKDCNTLGTPAIISQTVNAHSSNVECIDTSEGFNEGCNSDSQNSLSYTEIGLNTVSDMIGNLNHIDDQTQLDNVSNSIEQQDNYRDAKIIKTKSEEEKLIFNSAMKEDQTEVFEELNKHTLIQSLLCSEQSVDTIKHSLSTDNYPNLPVAAILQNGQPKDVSNTDEKNPNLQIKGNCYSGQFESEGCSYSNSRESTEDLAAIKNEQPIKHVNGLIGQSTVSNSQSLVADDKSIIADDNAVMQTVVEGTLQPLSMASSETEAVLPVVDDEDSSSLFAGVKEMILLDQESRNVFEIIENNSVEAVKLESIMAAENLETESCLTDISASANLNSSLCPLESSGVSTEFGHILELDGKPSYMKLLPLKNGHSLWNMHDLRLAVAQYGTVHLRLCAAPDSTDRSEAGSQCNFSALFLDDEIPPNNSEDFDSSNVIKNKTNESRSCQTDFGNLNLPINVTQSSCTGLLSDYSYGLKTPVLPESSAIKRPCLSPPMKNIPYPTPITTGRKRGRPPILNKGEIMGSITAFPSVMEGANIPFKLSKKRSSMGSIWKKYDKLQRCEPSAGKNGGVQNIEEDRERSLGYKKLLSLTCVQCGAIFRNKSALSNHVKAKHQLYKMCRICHERIHLQDKYSLRRHLLKAHKDRDQLMCSKCNVSFKVILHLKRHNNIIHETSESSDISSCEAFSEDECPPEKNNTPSTSPRLKPDPPAIDVIKPQKPITVKALPDDANDCNVNDDIPVGSASRRKLRSSASAAVLKNGSNRSSDGSSSSSSETAESGNESDAEDSSSDDSEEKKRFSCKKCNSSFRQQRELTRHMSDHVANESPTEEMSVDDEDDEPALGKQTSSEGKSKSCESSGKDFALNVDNDHNEATKTIIKRKGNRSAAQYSRPCTRSGRYFNKDSGSPPNSKQTSPPPKGSPSNSTKLKADDENDSGDDSSTVAKRPAYIVRKGRVLYCTKCNVNFKREKMMTYHLKKIHETLYPFRACPDCGKIFRSCGPFNRHMMQHRFTYCPVEGCKVRCRNVRLVKKHQKNGHPDHPYRCHRCLHMFKKKAQLNQHTNEAHTHKQQDDDDDEQSVGEVEVVVKAKKNDSVPVVVSGKRQRHGPVSYEEVDEDEVSVRRRGVNTSKKRKISQIADPPTMVNVSKKLKSTKLKTKPIISSSNSSSSVLKNSTFFKKLANIDFKSDGKSKKPVAVAASKAKKLTTSWTAALKAKYQANKLTTTKKVAVAHPVVNNKSSNPKNSQPDSPAITDDVIRRVSDALLSRAPVEVVKKPKPAKKKPVKMPAVKARKDTKVAKRVADPQPLSPSQSSEENPANVLDFDLF